LCLDSGLFFFFLLFCFFFFFHFYLFCFFFVFFVLFDSLFLCFSLFFFVFLVLAVKYPLWPFYSWLPEVHVEATTEFSIILAGVVLKVGFFGVFKFLFLWFYFMTLWFCGFFDGLILVGLSFCFFVLLYLVDYKKLVAFWSLLHTGLCLVLLWHNDLLFSFLCFLCNFAHLFSSLFMFFLLGLIYDLFGLRVFFLLYSFFGLTLFSFLFVFSLLFNLDFPFMLMFYFEFIFCFGVMCCSFWYFFLFFFEFDFVVC